MKTAKKLLVLLLAVVMVASLLVACNNDKPVETKPQETQGGNKPAETKPAETEPAEPVKLTFMYGQADVIPEDSIAGQFFKQVEEHCGVEIEWILPPSSAYQDQLQLTLLEEERPDAIIFPLPGLTTFPTSMPLRQVCSGILPTCCPTMRTS